MARISVDITERQFKNAAAEKRKNIEELYDELKKNEDKYNSGSNIEFLPDLELPEKPDIEKIDFKKKSDDELKSDADKLLRPKLNEQLKEAENSLSDANRKLEGSAEKKQLETHFKTDEVQRDFERRQREAENGALKRGLSRSSIIAEEVDQLKAQATGETDKLTAALTGELDLIQRQIDENVKKLDEAKNSFDGKLQSAIEAKLLDLLDEQENKFRAVAAHNNNVELQLLKYDRDVANAENQRAKTQASQMEKYMRYGAEFDREEYLKNNYRAVRDYVASLSKEEALKVLNDDATVKKALGSYYSVLKDAILKAK